MFPSIIALQVYRIYHVSAAAVDDTFPERYPGIGAQGHPHPETVDHFPQPDNGKTVIHRLVVDTDRIGADLLLQNTHHLIQGAVGTSSGDHTWLSLAAVYPVPDIVIGIG